MNEYVYCYTSPYLLDTQEKVDWANRFLVDAAFTTVSWRLGDSCFYRPKDDKKMPTGGAG